MADEQTFELLLKEFRRVGVDPDTFSAMLALRPEDALHAMKVLPDGAGASAFLSQLRQNGVVVSSSPHGRDARKPHPTQRRDKTA